MTTISGFTFIHNAIAGGYPILEAIRAVQPYVDDVVVVDCESTDGTKEMLDNYALSVKNWLGLSYVKRVHVIRGNWGNKAGDTLREAHSHYGRCGGDVIVHFEADEVYDDSLIRHVVEQVRMGHHHLSVYRLQLSQNFQRCRWYPDPVHRVFPKNSHARKQGHTTNLHTQASPIPPEHGFLWDITNCFRDNWFNRVDQQAELRGAHPQYLLEPLHVTHEVRVDSRDLVKYRLKEPHWTWKTTPFDIPEILKPLVGMTAYEPKI